MKDPLALLLLVILLGATVIAQCGCSSHEAECERVLDAIRAKVASCDEWITFTGSCDGANYIEGDVDKCLADLKAASCNDLDPSISACLALFGHAGLP